MIIIFVVCLFDTVYSIIYTVQPYATNALRPGVLLLILASSRAHFKSIFVLIADSIVMIFTIFAFVGFYSFCGYYIFKESYEGYN